MYRFLLFDADDTLFDFGKCEANALRASMDDCGLTYSEELNALYSKVNLKLWKELERGKLTRERLIAIRFRRFFDAAHIDADPEPMRISYPKRLSEQAVLLPGVPEMLKRLTETKKYRLFVITNGLKTTQTERFAASGIREYFEDIFISEEMGFNKPDKRYFDVVEKRVPGFVRSEALIIGDSLSSDIQGGINAEIDTAWYNFKLGTNFTGIRPTYMFRTWEELYNILEM